jgi:hypothetical protein
VLKRGALLRLETCGGRGWGDPLERDPERVAVLGDVLTPYGFAETNLRERFLASSADPWLGTGQIGRSASAPSALRASSRRRWNLLRLLGYRAPPDGHL